MYNRIMDKLTRKQQAFVRHLLDNPKDSATEAARQAYNVSSDNSASLIASENLRKPQIMAYLENYSTKAEHTIVKHMVQDKDKRLSFDAARDILDRLHGKATQRQEVKSTSVTVNVNLTSDD